MFIVLEGCEGSGKTTQAKLLAQTLSRSFDVHFTREPGGSVLAEKIRNLVLESEISDPLTEYLMLLAARKDHIDAVIKPKIAAGDIVICDRFIASSLAYQGEAKGLDKDLIIDLHSQIAEGFIPDLTLILDLDYETSTSRIGLDVNRNTNHYDMKDVEFFNKIRNSYLSIDSAISKNIAIIDARASAEEVSQKILEVVLKTMMRQLGPEINLL